MPFNSSYSMKPVLHLIRINDLSKSEWKKNQHNKFQLKKSPRTKIVRKLSISVAMVITEGLNDESAKNWS